jgi:hypothetical protein
MMDYGLALIEFDIYYSWMNLWRNLEKCEQLKMMDLFYFRFYESDESRLIRIGEKLFMMNVIISIECLRVFNKRAMEVACEALL